MSAQEFNTQLSYTKDQLNLYLKRISFFKNGEPQDKEIPVNYETLERVTRGHVNSIPYGNLAYIYYKRLQEPEGNYPCDIRDPLTTRGVSTDVQDIYNKLVLEQRDGVCAENNLLCAYMLMTLGFRTYITWSNNVNSHIWDQYGTIELQSNLHFTIIVELDSKEFLLDVGSRSGGTSKPILMQAGLIQESNPLVEFRISRAPYPDTTIQITNPKHFPWLLEAKTKQLPNRPLHRRNYWTPIKYINTGPVYLKDIQEICNASNHTPVVKMLRSCVVMIINTEEGFNTLTNQTLRIYSIERGVTTIKLHTEEERRAAYKQYFNVEVPEDHIEYLPNIKQYNELPIVRRDIMQAKY